MAIKDFTPNDYYSAAIDRLNDLAYLRKSNEPNILALYCAGLSIECLFRAYITSYTKEFDAKHNLMKLYDKSLLAHKLNNDEKMKMAIAIKHASAIWSNDLRYTSEKRMKRLIALNTANAGFKDVNKYIDKNYASIFTAADTIIKIGIAKWN